MRHVPLPLATLPTCKNRGTAGYVFYFPTSFPVSIFPSHKAAAGSLCCLLCEAQLPPLWFPTHQGPSRLPGTGEAAWQAPLPGEGPGRASWDRALLSSLSPREDRGCDTLTLPWGPPSPPRGLSASPSQWEGDSYRVSNCPSATILPPSCHLAPRPPSCPQPHPGSHWGSVWVVQQLKASAGMAGGWGYALEPCGGLPRSHHSTW